MAGMQQYSSGKWHCWSKEHKCSKSEWSQLFELYLWHRPLVLRRDTLASPRAAAASVPLVTACWYRLVLQSLPWVFNPVQSSASSQSWAKVCSHCTLYPVCSSQLSAFYWWVKGVLNSCFYFPTTEPWVLLQCAFSDSFKSWYRFIFLVFPREFFWDDKEAAWKSIKKV